MEVTFEPLEQVGEDSLRFAVIISRCQGKWVYCRHRERDTWEVPGGTREPGEAILDTAKRELWEETGADRYTLVPIEAYAYGGSSGLLCFAEIEALGDLPALEIERIQLFDREPDNLTYPHIQPHLFRRVQAYLGQKPPEYQDVYDQQRRPLGKTRRRGDPIPAGEYHLVAEVWTVNGDGEVLMTLRAPQKNRYPGLWETTSGAVQAGETTIQSAVRELREETGIAATQAELRFLGTYKTQDAFMDAYLLHRDIPLGHIVLQPGETTAAKWVSLGELEQMIAQGETPTTTGKRLNAFRAAIERELLGAGGPREKDRP